jgi:hypothetical protein
MPFLRGLLVLVLALPLAAVAERETPVTQRDIPDPSLCRVEPRSLAFFAELAGTPTPAGNRAVVAASPITPPPGGKVDDATTEAIATTVREVIACRNANDLLRTDALYTDAFFLRQIAVSGPPDLDFLSGRATPVPLDPGQWVAIGGIRGVRFLPDGRVNAIVDLIFPSEDVAFSFVFTHVSDRWLIDDETILSRNSTGS